MNSIEIIQALSSHTKDAADASGIDLYFNGQEPRRTPLYARATLEDMFAESRSIGDKNITQHSTIGTWTVDLFKKDKNNGDGDLLEAAKIFEDALSFACLTITPSNTRIFIEQAPSILLTPSDGFLRVQIVGNFRATGTKVLNPEKTIDLS
jgi:hypothetical protein